MCNKLTRCMALPLQVGTRTRELFEIGFRSECKVGSHRIGEIWDIGGTVGGPRSRLSRISEQERNLNRDIIQSLNFSRVLKDAASVIDTSTCV